MRRSWSKLANRHSESLREKELPVLADLCPRPGWPRQPLQRQLQLYLAAVGVDPADVEAALTSADVWLNGANKPGIIK